MLVAIGQPGNALAQHLAGNAHAAVIAPAAVAPEKLVGIWHPGVGRCYVARASNWLDWFLRSKSRPLVVRPPAAPRRDEGRIQVR